MLLRLLRVQPSEPQPAAESTMLRGTFATTPRRSRATISTQRRTSTRASTRVEVRHDRNRRASLIPHVPTDSLRSRPLRRYAVTSRRYRFTPAASCLLLFTSDCQMPIADCRPFLATRFPCHELTISAADPRYACARRGTRNDRGPHASVTHAERMVRCAIKYDWRRNAQSACKRGGCRSARAFVPWRPRGSHRGRARWRERPGQRHRFGSRLPSAVQVGAWRLAPARLARTAPFVQDLERQRTEAARMHPHRQRLGLPVAQTPSPHTRLVI